jgi:hypothetical protein
MQTLTHYKKTELLLQIPKRYMITSEEVKTTDKGVALISLMTKQGIDFEHFNHMLVLYQLLLDKQNPESSLRPYHDTFPASLTEFPCAWSQEDVAQLQAGTCLYTATIITLSLLLCLHTTYFYNNVHCCHCNCYCYCCCQYCTILHTSIFIL